MRSAGFSNVSIYQGVVEDRMDPLKLGRVRVRVLGVHSEDVSQVPVGDLPWAVIAASPTNAGVSGLGWSPTGLALGSWVFVQFVDDALQVPIVVGTSYGVNPMSKVESVTGDSTMTIQQPVDETVLTPQQQAQKMMSGTYDGNVWTSDSKTTVASDVTSTPSDNLGTVSAKYESNGNPGTVSGGTGDYGGISYGAYQLSSKQGTCSEYVKQSKYQSEFVGTTPGTPEFTAKWKALAARDSAGFLTDQHDFIKKTIYSPCCNKLPSLADRGTCVQNAIWSCAVQHGKSGGASVINKALAGQDVTLLSNADICTLIKDYQSNNVQTLFKKSPTLWSSLQARYAAEKKDLLAMCGDSVTPTVKPIAPVKDPYKEDVDPGPPVASTPKEPTPIKRGFIDPSGRLPKAGYLGKPDTNRLARAEETQYTLLEFKERTRTVGNGYAEPVSPYAAKYPNNKVYMSESGHVIEIDDTPKGERIHVWHKSGSYIEFQPDGTIVKKSYKDDHEIVLGEDKTYVTGNMSVFVEGNVSFKTLGNFSIAAEGNVSIMAGGSMDISSVGGMALASSGSITESAAGELVFNGKTIKQNMGGGSGAKSVDVGAKLAMLKSYELEDTSTWNTDEPVGYSTKADIEKSIGRSLDTGEPPVQPQPSDAKPIQPGADVVTDTSDPNPRLSEHYWLKDLTTGVRLFPHALEEQAGLTREQLIANLKGLAINVLEPLVTVYGKDGFIITSAFRPTDGATKASQHHKGEACDIQFPGKEMIHMARDVKATLPKFDQMILEYGSSSNPVLHISYSLSASRNDAFTTLTPQFHAVIPKGFYDKQGNLVYKT